MPGTAKTESQGISTQVLVILVFVVILVLLVIILLVVLQKCSRKKRETPEAPVIEDNNYYGVKYEDYYEDRDTEVVDLNDYYEY